ncbi:hypothetical protein GMA11_04240 [Granulicatella sp. zg-ZJ]|uniref:YczE/YyaS/YitT family protein n=1 Tax=unclassified Granulicatella TaxID=2630493 RepID=UPI0013C05628|nr:MULTISPECIES: YitT family protein [unclassified Granulicatella]MBS4750750.1 YitT family protein [Carnobacteriaceae bacterium zg-ZUI78]NEW62598.1 hypothetical protein [Granulicatella sp. zg-ZJ]NEW66703.1 hypothetical protein [Granulicatella sp. zg-84]QMI85998.1 YitT family protein [Carnobacteriaceae bacterium zg-84]
MRKIGTNFVLTTIFMMLAAVGVSLTLKADIGFGSVNSLSSALATVTSVEVGTVLMSINIVCVFIQLLLQRRDFHWRQWLQVGAAYILGIVVNLMIYRVLTPITLDHYFLRVLVFVSGVVLSGFAVAAIIRLDLVVFPLEAACKVIADKYGVTFRKVRQWVDVITLLLAVLFMLTFGSSLVIREGTLINMICLAPVTQFFLNRLEQRNIFHAIRFE